MATVVHFQTVDTPGTTHTHTVIFEREIRDRHWAIRAACEEHRVNFLDVTHWTVITNVVIVK